MPNQPAPPAPTPTMASAIKRAEDRMRSLRQIAEQYERMSNRHWSEDAALDGTRNEIAHLDLALSAMRAVEAGPVGYVPVRDGEFLHQSVGVTTRSDVLPALRWTAEEAARALEAAVVPLYAFPSPDGGSAT